MRYVGFVGSLEHCKGACDFQGSSNELDALKMKLEALVQENERVRVPNLYDMEENIEAAKCLFAMILDSVNGDIHELIEIGSEWNVLCISKLN
mgnify:CR=1 FL=1